MMVRFRLTGHRSHLRQNVTVMNSRTVNHPAEPSRQNFQFQIRSLKKSSFSRHMFKKFTLKLLGLAVLIPGLVFNIAAQVKNPLDKGLVQQQGTLPPPDDGAWMYSVGFAIFFIGCIAVLLWIRAKKAQAVASKSKDSGLKRDSWDSDQLDGDKEMEWLRKNNDTINRKRRKKPARKNFTREDALQNGVAKPEPALSKEIQLASASELPFNSILRLEYPHGVEAMQSSQDESLMEAIEQVLDEFNEDEEMKELSMRIIAAFKTSNSVEALSQVALYDLQANTRCRAIEILGEFDHDSVFEPIILACADPTREVRAAAARMLTRLGFNRADAWARMSLIDDEGRMRQIARAAIEGGLVERYFDRLTHKDYKQAYEAFALFTLLLKARETQPIATALESHPSHMVRIALIHVIKVNKELDSLPFLLKLSERKDLPKEVWESVEDAIKIFSPEPEEVEVA
jgi:hypothetical protein